MTELTKEEFEQASKGQVNNDVTFKDGAGVVANFAKSDTFAAIAEATGNDDLKKASEIG